MTPEQLERIKECLEGSEYSEATNCIRSKSDQRPFAFITYQIFDPALVGQFITDAINEKLERTENLIQFDEHEMSHEQGNYPVTAKARWFNSLYHLSEKAQEAIKGWDYKASAPNNKILHQLVQLVGYARSAKGIMNNNDILPVTSNSKT